jgi:alpha-glucuronidase
MPKQEQVTKFNAVVTDAQGNTEAKPYLSEAQLADLKTESAKDSKTVNETKAQTYAITQAESIDDILQCVPDADVALSYFNYGYKLNQQNVMRDLMKDADWQGVEGVYDLNQDVQQAKEKRVADPLSSSRRSLKALFAKLNPGAPEPTDEEINAVLAQFVGAAA